MPATESPRARYDGIAEWYDEQVRDAPHRRQVLRGYLQRGHGTCLDLGCGTGRDLPVVEEFGWTAVGLELSGGLLRLARRYSGHLVRADAEHLPFASDTFPMVVSCWTSTDVDRFDVMLTEVARVLRANGSFLFYGAHPCFNGPHVQNRPDGSRIVHPTYRQARRHTFSPWWGEDGIRTAVGGMRQVPLADFLNAFARAGLRIDEVAEPGAEPVPHAIVVRAGLSG